MRGVVTRGGWVRVVLLLALFLLAGAAAGVLWHAVWTPPTGVAYEGQWFLEPAGPDVAVSGTALYVLIAAVTGIVLGVLAGTLPRHELLTLATAFTAAVIGGVAMYYVGHALGPAAPQPLAAGQPDFTSIPSDLVVATASSSEHPFTATGLLAMPAGVVTGLAVVYLLGRQPAKAVAGAH